MVKAKGRSESKTKSKAKRSPAPSKTPRMRHWHECASAVREHVFRIETPSGAGTGFYIGSSVTGGVIGIATAAHVIWEAHRWEQPIRLIHESTGKSLLVKEPQRAIMISSGRDAAAIGVVGGEFKLPTAPLRIMAPGSRLKVGVEVGWLGYPRIASGELCFFSGRISLYRATDQEYLVDGVAIHGVSGGPAFNLHGGVARLIGVVTAYVPNRLTGESLPGLAMALDVSALKDEISTIRTFGEAKREETKPPTEPLPSPPTEEEGSIVQGRAPRA